MTRVLATADAKRAIDQLRNIIDGGFADEIRNLDREGQTLSDREVWDGPLAEQFRGDVWPSTKSALDKAKSELENLRSQLDKIAQNIMAAGGGGA